MCTSEFVSVNGTIYIYFNWVSVIFFNVNRQIHGLSAQLTHVNLFMCINIKIEDLYCLYMYMCNVR